MPEATIHIGDCIDSMRRLPAASVHCCVTSPPSSTDRIELFTSLIQILAHLNVLVGIRLVRDATNRAVLIWEVPVSGPCILAGTSEKGCCAACGAPWERDMEVIERAGHKPRLDEKRFKCGSGEHPSSVRKFKGWVSTCECNAEPIPCTVLDPFGGAGTSALVALAKGRNAILCELNPEYAEMARKRVENDAPMFNRVKIAA